MSVLCMEVQRAFKAAAAETRAGKLTILGQRVGAAFNYRLGGSDIFATDREWSGELLHTVVDHTGVALMFSMGGAVTCGRRESDICDRIYYQTVGGVGRAIKFVPHAESDSVQREDFFGVGFPYPAHALCLTRLQAGTVARVKGIALRPAFSIDAISRVTADGVDDVRIFDRADSLICAVHTVFEEFISDSEDEWRKMLRLLDP